MTHILSFVILVLLLYGRSLVRKNLSLHIKVVSIAMILDVIFVSYLAFAESALTKVGVDMPWILWIHIPMALTCLIFYLLITYYGIRIWKGDRHYLPCLRRCDVMIVSLRAGVFLTGLGLMLF